MRLQEAVEVVPNPRDPVDDPHQLHVARPAADLRLDQLPPQVAAQEAFHRLHVVGAQHPPGQKEDTYVGTVHQTRESQVDPSARQTQRVPDASSRLPEVVVKLQVGGR